MEQKKITITDLTIDEINAILIGLGKLPLESVVTLFEKIKAQAQEQLALKEEEEEVNGTN
jgi:hypothetical protein